MKKNPTFREARAEIIQDLLSHLTTNPDEAKTAALIAHELQDHDAEWVTFWIERARMDGHLVVENERGFYIAPSYEHFDAWRKAYVIPQMTLLLDMLTSMGKEAKQRFNRSIDESVLPFVAG